MTIFRIHALYNQQEPNAHTVDYAHTPDYVKAVYLTGSVLKFLSPTKEKS